MRSRAPAKNMHTGVDLGIAQRVCECIEDNAIGSGYTVSQELKALGVSRQLFFRWKSGGLPSAMALRQMARRGYDIHFILLGNKTGDS